MLSILNDSRKQKKREYGASRVYMDEYHFCNAETIQA